MKETPLETELRRRIKKLCAPSTVIDQHDSFMDRIEKRTKRGKITKEEQEAFLHYKVTMQGNEETENLCDPTNLIENMMDRQGATS